MELNKINKRKAFQFFLLGIGILLTFLIYFNNPAEDNKPKLSKNIDDLDKQISEQENTSVFENLEYKGIDKNGNKFVIFSEYSDFTDEKPEIINMKKIICFFYFKDGTILEIRSEKGVYNNVSLDMSFDENVKMFYADNSLFSDKADFSNSKNRLFIEGNVKTESPNGDIKADKLNFDFTDKKLKVSMYDIEERVNVKTKLR